MKKILCAILAGTLLLALCACGTKKTETSASPSASPEASVSPPASSEATTAAPSETAGASPSAAAETKALASVLDDINARMEPGTAGSGLKAAKLAAELLDWAQTSPLSAGEIKAQTLAWLSPKGNDEQSAFAGKLGAVNNAVGQVREAGGKELLQEAGVTDSLYPWSDKAAAAVKTVVDTVLG